jgi:hypothetical protein
MDKDKKQTVQRMTELMKPIERQIMMCDDRHDLLMMASAMMIAVKDIFDNEIGEEGRKKMFKELT